MILLGDARAIPLPDASVAAVVTDPPYGLEFMGVAWDTMRDDGRARTRNEWRDFGTREHPRHSGQTARINRNKGLALHAFCVAWAAECMRVLVPGGRLLAFGAPRTSHRIWCAIEDAGFVIEDTALWIFGSGFPKHKSKLKPAYEPVVWASKPLKVAPEFGKLVEESTLLIEALIWHFSPAAFAEKISTLVPVEQRGSVRWIAAVLHGAECAERSELTDMFSSREAGSTCLNIASSWSAILDALSAHASTFTTATESGLITGLRTLNCWLSATTPEHIIRGAFLRGGLTCAAPNVASFSSVTAVGSSATPNPSAVEPATWQIGSALLNALALIAESLSLHLRVGSVDSVPLIATVSSGERLSPAYEPICVARKGPVTALNIDGCRIGTTDTRQVKRGGPNDFPHEDDAWAPRAIVGGSANGRWPANVLLDEDAAAALDEMSGTLPCNKPEGRRALQGTVPAGIMGFGTGRDITYPDSGGASRFFYTAKASRSERERGLEGMLTKPAGMMQDDAYEWPGTAEHSPHRTPPARNHHPTVKPLALMRYLVRLVTQPGDLVLDPFMGSGSTGVACIEEGRRFVGMDNNPEYVAIARRRIGEAQPTLFGAA
jgi:DNA modification methylase